MRQGDETRGPLAEKETREPSLCLKVDGYFRDVDAEYKILSDIAKSLGDDKSATGIIKLLTERPPCNSCADVIKQFTNKYPNIVIEVVHNKHKLLLP